MTACLVCSAPASAKGYCSRECKEILERRRVPRGTRPHWTTRYPTVAPVPQDEDTILYTSPPMGDVAQLNRRRVAAGYAHLYGLAVEGSPMVEALPRHRKPLLFKALDGLIYVCAATMIALVVVLAVYLVMYETGALR